MLDTKENRMLELLDDIMSKCIRCELYNGGHVTPYWTTLSKYVIIGEAPGREEVEQNEPFVGKTGRLFWQTMSDYGFRKEEFLIINSVQCRPTDGKKNLKPSESQIKLCRLHWKKYIKILTPYKMLLLGNYAYGAIHGRYSGILGANACTAYSDEFNIKYVSSVHPSYCIYNKDGDKLLRKSIKNFRIISGGD